MLVVFVNICILLETTCFLIPRPNLVRVHYAYRLKIARVDNSESNPLGQTLKLHETSSGNINNLNSTVPTVNELLRFGLPTLGIWLLQPILSLIDSSVVGICAKGSISELAALGPSIIWCDGTAYLFQFLGIATTNLYATAIGENDELKSRQVISQALVIAGLLGSLVGVVQFSLARPVITILSGASAKELMPFAMSYIRIRAVGAPAALLTLVTQAAFLARKDAVTPLRAVVVGAAINLFGDILCVLFLKMGLAGAALATMVSQVGGGLYLLGVVLHQKHLENQRLDKEPDCTSVDVSDITISTRNTLKTRITRKVSSWNSIQRLFPRNAQLPSVRDLFAFLSFAGPIFFVLLSKQGLWTYATICASDSGTVGLAAHQIVINFFLFFCIFGDAVSQMSQSYLPGLLGQLKDVSGVKSFSKANISKTNINSSTSITSTISTGIPATSVEDLTVSLRKTISRILTIGLGVGVVNALFSLTLPTIAPRLFTKSDLVISAMARILPLLSLCLMPHCLMSALEGVLLASGRTKLLSLGYLGTGLCFVLLQSIARRAGKGLQGVWIGLVVFQYLRLSVFGSMVWWNIFRNSAITIPASRSADTASST